MAEFQKLGVVPLLADFTTWKPESVAFLSKHYHRKNLPVNVVFSPDPDVPPLILPEFLGQDQVLEGIRLMASKGKPAE